MPESYLNGVRAAANQCRKLASIYYEMYGVHRSTTYMSCMLSNNGFVAPEAIVANATRGVITGAAIAGAAIGVFSLIMQSTGKGNNDNVLHKWSMIALHTMTHAAMSFLLIQNIAYMLIDTEVAEKATPYMSFGDTNYTALEDWLNAYNVTEDATSFAESAL